MWWILVQISGIFCKVDASGLLIISVSNYRGHSILSPNLLTDIKNTSMLNKLSLPKYLFLLFWNRPRRGGTSLQHYSRSLLKNDHVNTTYMFYCRTKISLCSNEIPMALHRDKVGDAEDDSNTIYKDLKLNQWSRRIDLFKSLQSLYSLYTCIPCSEVLTSTYIEEHNCFSKDTWIYVLAWISKLSWIESISLCKLDSDLSLILQNLARGSSTSSHRDQNQDP